MLERVGDGRKDCPGWNPVQAAGWKSARVGLPGSVPGRGGLGTGTALLEAAAIFGGGAVSAERGPSARIRLREWAEFSADWAEYGADRVDPESDWAESAQVLRSRQRTTIECTLDSSKAIFGGTQTCRGNASAFKDDSWRAGRQSAGSASGSSMCCCGPLAYG
ncbi:hypothetical protein KFL_002450120 [Klebsormidium nitens]|uniref:Uncharacterized protein n=1 Tax=Klebsormidium nitens TaxID=105231 RepID=A0A1Y1I865_KLENI|nr:hypothetical protein KFL_002450120 [Klebsormidium nitens]|eukprot:GAQ85619.1 hypothetical protein KFL_002450120 [Klebsormidium nitens]